MTPGTGVLAGLMWSGKSNFRSMNMCLLASLENRLSGTYWSSSGGHPGACIGVAVADAKSGRDNAPMFSSILLSSWLIRQTGPDGVGMDAMLKTGLGGLASD